MLAAESTLHFLPVMAILERIRQAAAPSLDRCVQYLAWQRLLCDKLRAYKGYAMLQHQPRALHLLPAVYMWVLPGCNANAADVISEALAGGARVE